MSAPETCKGEGIKPGWACFPRRRDGCKKIITQHFLKSAGTTFCEARCEVATGVETATICRSNGLEFSCGDIAGALCLPLSPASVVGSILTVFHEQN